MSIKVKFHFHNTNFPDNPTSVDFAITKGTQVIQNFNITSVQKNSNGQPGGTTGNCNGFPMNFITATLGNNFDNQAIAAQGINFLTELICTVIIDDDPNDPNPAPANFTGHVRLNYANGKQSCASTLGS